MWGFSGLAWLECWAGGFDTEGPGGLWGFGGLAWLQCRAGGFDTGLRYHIAHIAHTAHIAHIARTWGTVGVRRLGV